MNREYTHNQLNYMYLCVIAQAVKDAFLFKERKPYINKRGKLVKYTSEEIARRDAVYWLCSDKEDFYTVCSWAGVSADRIRKKAIELVNLPKDERRKQVHALMRDCYAWNKSSANKGKSKKYL